jgi:hypothetical protein
VKASLVLFDTWQSKLFTPVPWSDFTGDGGVARMSDPAMIDQIKAAVTIPVMAKARIGHFIEAKILDTLVSISRAWFTLYLFCDCDA